MKTLIISVSIIMLLIAGIIGYNLKQHWFLRDVKREKQSLTTNGTISYLLKSTLETLQKFPHHFNILQMIELGDEDVNISLYVQNKGEHWLSFAPGHHTYYKVDPSQKKNIELDDNMQVTNEMKNKRINGEETIVVPNPGRSKMRIPGTGEIETYYDPKFKDIRLRSEKDKWFVCKEPVVDEAKNRLQSAIIIKQWEIMNVWISIKLLSKDNR